MELENFTFGKITFIVKANESRQGQDPCRIYGEDIMCFELQDSINSLGKASYPWW